MSEKTAAELALEFKTNFDAKHDAVKAIATDALGKAERGEAMTEAIDKLSEHCDALQTVSGELDELTGN